VAEDHPTHRRRMLASLGPGTRVAGYRLEAPVGAGGMAAVYRAHDEQLDRVVALKLVYAGPGLDRVVRERFVREALAVARVDHPHIIPVYAAGEADDFLYIAMRFVPDGDLRTVVDSDGPLPARRAAAVVSPVASALDTAHEHKLVHRDVKPANILVDAGHGKRPDHVYLSDFGLARGVLSAGGLTQDGQFVGTPDYASPEQIKGQQTDGHADQYSLACVAYTILTGLVPYVRENPMAVLFAQLDEAPPRATDVQPDLPRAVDSVLAKAMAKRPGRRYESCGAFADAFREALGVGPYDSTRPSHPVTVPGSRKGSPRDERTREHRAPDVPARDVAAGGDWPPYTAKLTVPLDAPQSQPDGPQPGEHQTAVRKAVAGQSVTARTWTAVVTADPAYYESVQAANEQEAAAISFPDRYAQRRIRLAGAEISVGRRSRSRHIEPDIDLTGDPGVSRLHAVLTAEPDGTWRITDQDSPNGTQVNGREIAAREALPLRDGDYINLGAWTRITLTCD
jgi:serine/threonine protein kinase